jgi:serine/threonine protein kinase
VSCSGYLPPEYIRSCLVSNKFDIFSLGVVIIKIMAGSTGYFTSADMSSQEFISLVRKNGVFPEIKRMSSDSTMVMSIILLLFFVF